MGPIADAGLCGISQGGVGFVLPTIFCASSAATFSAANMTSSAHTCYTTTPALFDQRVIDVCSIRQEDIGQDTPYLSLP